MKRKMVDCRDQPSVNNCSLLMSGEEEELLDAAVMHAVTVHGHEESAELREQIKNSMKDEPREFPNPSEEEQKSFVA